MKFNLRGFISITTALSFIFISISGIVLYFTPQGRIAYWFNWKFLGLTKTDWTNLHIIFSLIFLIAASLHIYYNWNVLIAYVYNKTRKAINLKKELTFALFLAIICIVGSVKPFPPFSWYIKLSDYLKQAWVKSPEYEPPFGHAELLSLEEFTKRRNIDLGLAIKALRDSNIVFSSPKESLKSIALANRISPMELYRLLKPLEGTGKDATKTINLKAEGESPKAIMKQDEPKVVSKDTQIKRWTRDEIIETFERKGIGRKSLKEIASEVSIDVSVALNKLRAKGIQANEKDTLREIAGRYNTSPIEILVEILIDEPKNKDLH